MERELTKFQTQCEERLTSALARIGRRVADRRLDGQSETYIEGSIKGRDITFWIYEDGADFHAGKRHRLFERPDYDSLDDLAADFVAKLTEVAA
ncbi:MAG: hypothetical protein ACLQU3_19870 [Limisphaerales bacterium]